MGSDALFCHTGIHANRTLIYINKSLKNRKKEKDLISMVTKPLWCCRKERGSETTAETENPKAQIYWEIKNQKIREKETKQPCLASVEEDVPSLLQRDMTRLVISMGSLLFSTEKGKEGWEGGNGRKRGRKV